MKKTILRLLAALYVVAPFSLAIAAEGSANGAALHEGFETPDAVPSGWQAEGDARVTDAERFEGVRSLRLGRDEAHFDAQTSATGPTQPYVAGAVELCAAVKTDLRSPDASFRVAVSLECLDAAGKAIETVRVAEVAGTTAWQPVRKQAELPADTATVRWRVELLKATGQIWVDELSVAPAAPAPAASPVRRVLLRGEKPGNLLYPGDRALFRATVLTAGPLPEDSANLCYVVRDYWGAEQAAGGTVRLVAAGEEKGLSRYEATVDLGGQAFEADKYYELHVTIPAGAEPSRESTSFAFLPEAPTKKHSWRDIPFTSRDWDNRIPDFVTLSDRLGLRVAGLWAGWQIRPPYEAHAPNLDLVRRYDMGALAGTPIHQIEAHLPGYELIDERALREGVRNLLGKFNSDDRLLITLGNEPQTAGPTVAANVAAYKIVYDEIKKVSPGTFVVGTSIGPAEEYFKLGFQHYCDAVDYHMYEDSRGVDGIFEKYRALFDKYGGRKPIWSTETGLNSQGLTRRAIATDLIRKFALFFANGGANISWFDICYPDREGKLRGGADDSFNVFDGLYGLYHPRLDAVAYYHMVNAICVKKFVARQRYGDVQAFLFRDAEGHALQVWWNERSAQEVFVPLPGVQRVGLTRIDGSLETLDSDGRGVTLRVGEDPLLLQYDGGPDGLAAALEPPLLKIVSVPDAVVRGTSARIGLSHDLRLRGRPVPSQLPPGWQSHLETGKIGDDGLALTWVVLDVPADTGARFVPVSLGWETTPGHLLSDLTLAIPVRGQLSAQLLPSPAGPDGQPGVVLAVHNHSANPAKVRWKLSLEKEIPAVAGRYSLEASRPAQASFAEAAEGSGGEVPPSGEWRVRVPLARVDPLTAYQVRAVVTDDADRTTVEERFVGGFVAVPRVKAPPKLDGALDEPEWAECRAVKLNEARQYRALSKLIHWKGPQDLSAQARFLWDDKYLYLGLEVTDDVFHNNAADGQLWEGDGVQLLIDPARTQSAKPGKYDYGMALTHKGPQAWCFLSADGRVSAGEATDILVSARRRDERTGNMAYEIAIPWSRLLPFEPVVGSDLGMALILNEDDAPRRASFLTWFGDIQSKELAPVGDLVLQP